MKKTSVFRNMNTNNITTSWNETQSTTNESPTNGGWVSLSNNGGTTSLGWLSNQSWVSNSNNKNNSTSSVSLGSQTNSKLLSGTTEYFGVLDIVGILWVKPEFTLQDSRWNYFAYYWDHLDFIQTIKSLWWSVYEMVTESEILQNQLFGDRVSYINLSMFKDVRVIMVIEIDGEVWLLQVPADQYHNSKDYLKSLFIQ